MSPTLSEGLNEGPSEAEARRMYRILGNRVVEIRALRRGNHPQRAPSIGYFNNADDFADTAAEHIAALEAADRLIRLTASLDWPAGMVVDSGNGAYLLFRVDLPNTPDSVKLIADVLRVLAGRVDTDAVHLDTGVGNPARIVRVAGSINRKSPHTPGRPNRPVRVLSAPADDRLETVTVEQLRGLADTGTGAVSKPDTLRTTQPARFARAAIAAR